MKPDRAFPLRLPLLPFLLAILLVGASGPAEWLDIDAPSPPSGKRRESSAKLSNKEEGATWALVIGIEAYAHLPPVPYATRDAEAFYRFLQDYEGVTPERTLRRFGKNLPLQVEDIDGAVADLADRIREAQRKRARGRSSVRQDDRLWLYFAGHGAASRQGERLLLGGAAQSSLRSFERQGISVAEFLRPFQSLDIEIVTLIDACYTGIGRSGDALSAGRPAVPLARKELASLDRVIQWSAAREGQVARPIHEVKHGAFTYFAIGAMRGWADGALDGKRDGRVSAAEAERYLEKAFSQLDIREQRPRLIASASDRCFLASRVTEEGPLLARLPPPIDDNLMGRLEQLRALQKSDENEREAHRQRVAAARENIPMKARQAWKLVRSLAWKGGKEGEMALREFVEEYRKPVQVDDEELTIQVAELSEAEGYLRCLEGRGHGEIFVGSSGYEMACIPAGEFLMGSPESEPGRDSDETQHKVILSEGYLMGTTEVTQGLWRQVMGENPSKTRQRFWNGIERDACADWGVGDDLPVFCVDWHDAILFANRLSEEEKLEPVYRIEGEDVSWKPGATGYRLPTEAEWERAARGELGLMYGEVAAPEEVCQYANVANPSTKEKNKSWLTWDVFPCEDGFEGLAPVGKLLPNRFGLFDMVGNVWEWSWDGYGSDYYQDRQPDPRGPERGSNRVVRGGSWDDGPQLARVANRVRGGPSNRYGLLGFRLSRSL